MLWNWIWWWMHSPVNIIKAWNCVLWKKVPWASLPVQDEEPGWGGTRSWAAMQSQWWPQFNPIGALKYQSLLQSASRMRYGLVYMTVSREGNSRKALMTESFWCQHFHPCGSKNFRPEVHCPLHQIYAENFSVASGIIQNQVHSSLKAYDNPFMLWLLYLNNTSSFIWL